MNFVKRLRKWWLCRRYGVCPTHNLLRPYDGGYEGRWGRCPKCVEENRAKTIHRNSTYEWQRNAAVETIDRDWRR